MIRDADAGLKDRFGRLAYFWTGARNLRRRRGPTPAIKARREDVVPGQGQLRPRRQRRQAHRRHRRVRGREPRRRPARGRRRHRVGRDGNGRRALARTGRRTRRRFAVRHHGAPASKIDVRLSVRSPTSSTAGAIVRTPSQDQGAPGRGHGLRAPGEHRTMSTAQRVPETFELTGDDARETLLHTGRTTLVRDAFLRLRYSDGFSHARSLAFAVSLVVVQATIALVGFASVLGDRRRPAQHRPDPARDGTGAGRQPAGRGRATGRSSRCLTAVPRAVPRPRRRARHGRHRDGTGRAGAEPHLRRRAGPPDRREVHAGPGARDHGRACWPSSRSRRSTLASGIREVTDSSLAGDVWAVARWPLAVAAMMASVALLFRRAPRRRQPAWSWLAYRRHRRGRHLVGRHRAARLLLLDQLVVRARPTGRSPASSRCSCGPSSRRSRRSSAVRSRRSSRRCRAGQAEPQDAEKVEESEPEQEEPPLVGATMNADERGRG